MSDPQQSGLDQNSCAQAADKVSTDAPALADDESGTTSDGVKKKRQYIKPVLRRFTQIDYVTAYGID